jgi:hypothetical protein
VRPAHPVEGGSPWSHRIGGGATIHPHGTTPGVGWVTLLRGTEAKLSFNVFRCAFAHSE